MKLSLALSLATGNIHASKAERDVHELYENIETCGTIQLDNNSTEVHDQLVLGAEQDACLFRVKLGQKQNLEVKQFKIDLAAVNLGAQLSVRRGRLYLAFQPALITPSMAGLLRLSQPGRRLGTRKRFQTVLGGLP